MLEPLMREGRPHWEFLFPEELWPVFTDFRNALALIWDHLGLPEPTEAQYEIAHRLQYAADSWEWSQLTESERAERLAKHREDIIRCYRGAGKSYITAAFAAWLLARNPRDEKILVVSATGSKAQEFMTQVKGLLETMPLFTWLLSGTREGGQPRRDRYDRFDVAGSSLSQVCSARAATITGQITGARATTIIPDDIEIPTNSLTEESRSKIVNLSREFGVIVKTEHGRGDIIMLGTPQTEESVYNVMVRELGFSCFTIPVRVPPPEKMVNYILKRHDGASVDILAPYIRNKIETRQVAAHDLVDPKRFSIEELAREEAKGKAHFALQMMLDTSLSDAERYPLKQHDLIVFNVNPEKAPHLIQWGHDTERANRIDDLPNLGFSGDYFLRPLKIDKEWHYYDGKVLYVDPAGRGKDETAWAVVASLNGVLYVLHVSGYAGDPATAMMRIAYDAKRFKVNVIEVEPNFGQGMWQAAFQPVLTKVWPGGCTVVEGEWAKGQKEVRIIDTLEPVMAQHRLVVDEIIMREDTKATEGSLPYSLMYQLTHITRDRGALKHDDRLDALAGAVAHFQRSMEQDVDQTAQALKDQLMDDELERHWEAIEGAMSDTLPGHVPIRGRVVDGHREPYWQWTPDGGLHIDEGDGF